MKKKFLVLDGSSLMYRAFYALPLLSAASGEFTNAVLGFSNMLLKLLKEMKPDFLAIAFDKGKITFRNEMFSDYKGTRKPTPEELKVQIPLLRDFSASCGIAFVEKKGYEADDLIGTLATKAVSDDCEVMVVTGDRDALQLVRKGLTVMLTKKGISEMKLYDETAFEEEYQMQPLRLIDLKGLMGDASDNIPGVPGVGNKTATKLLLEYESLENIFEHVDEIKGKKLQENLSVNREQAFLSKKLATIHCDVPGVDFLPEKFLVHPDQEKLRAFCHKYGLKSVLKHCEEFFFSGAENALPFEEFVPAQKTISVQYKELVSREEIQDIAASKHVAVSVETEGKTPFLQLERLFLATEQGTYFVAENSSLFGEVISALQKMEQVWTFDVKQLYHAGIACPCAYFDISLAAYLLHPEEKERSLSYLMSEYLPSFALEKFDDALQRLAWETKAIFYLGNVLKEKLVEQKLDRLYAEIELPVVEVLAFMERTGIFVNHERLSLQAEKMQEKILSLENEIFSLTGEKFNINSPKQLGAILFERLNLPVIKKTKTGYSTNAEVLENLYGLHPVIEKILSYRTWTKLKSTYLDGLFELLNEKTHRVHTSFNQTVTATGRLSSSDPNLQNIPVRTEAGKEIRSLFEPSVGYDGILSADYSQIELRILAHMSQDKNFIDAFLHDEDVHACTAAEVFDVPLDEVSSELRRKAKAVNFGIVYGISDYGLSRDLHITRNEAADYINKYFSRYPGVKTFLDSMVALAHKDGYVTTLFGRKRELPAIRSRNFNQRSLAERMAMNTPIQGTAADIIKLAMATVFKRMQEAGFKSRMLLQVHDELVFEVVQEEIEPLSNLLRDAMEHIAELSVPLVIEINVGKDWAEAK